MKIRAARNTHVESVNDDDTQVYKAFGMLYII